ncbi:MFS transporter [Acinetobacter baumannii]|uniref:MFS transporter n=23 Tax=Gammaproteobacteria TaxID=1236 RepID=A0ABD5D5N9_ACIBA|nr:MFS transporter [Acinetobacter baumannii]AEP05531.1 MFS transporter [Acinetobacter baumannii MDR-ZJ06]AFI96433.1 sugar phosphate permease [Acinetobacter baumannii MDR-TJ]AOP62280.1 MFS family transporter [Acinetobacter baumannii DU202]AXQ89412.1 Putative metabolite transport protein NicT [Acinetobacter baumannii WM99c]AYX93604.1 MFS transporter [Acinetobacter sp. FDAARGOS_494]AYY16351.1 MFS transporter [Acinetobacter sp. FDAARGOS_560]EKB37003.1 D-galactonate transporter [Acinetobacter bau
MAKCKGIRMMDTVFSSEVDTTVRKSAYRKIAFRLMPFLMLCYFCAYLDRVNVGFAKLQMMSDLQFSEAVYGLGAGIFFIGYFLCEVPSNIVLHKVGARRWIARIMITWGILSGCFAFVQTEWQFYTLRFLLGVAEAGLAPGLLLYLTYWFPSYRRARMTVLWFIAIPISGMIGGPLSGLIMDRMSGVHGWFGWQWMFVIEAIPTVIVGLLVLAVLKDSVQDANWLTQDEKNLVKQELAQDNQHKEGHASVKEFIADKRLWLLAGIYFCVVMGQYAITFWLPTLIRNSGISDNWHIGLLTSLPYMCAIVVMILAGRSGDHFQERRWHLIIPMCAGAIALTFATLFASNLTLSLICLCIAASGVLTASSLFWMLPTNFLGGVSAAAGIAAVNSFANLAGFCSPYLIGWVTTNTGSNAIGMFLITAVLIFGASLVLRVPAKLVNR